MAKEQKVEIREIAAEEYGPHEPPPGAGENWQESWGFAWHDPLRRAGGINHLSIQRLRGIADVWSWVALDGRVVGKYQSLNLEPPEDDFPDWTLGGQSVTTHSGRSCRLQLSYENGTEADLNHEAFTDPFSFSFNVDGSTWGSSHYEAVGRVDGTVSVDGEETAVSGFSWQDHSWGERHWADTLSHRWTLANFGPELFISAIRLIPAEGPPVPVGFVHDNGEILRLADCTFGSRMGDDGHSPEGCDARIWTVEGKGYHVTGDVHTSSPSSHLEGFWFTDGLCTFECGGRLGAGIFEVQELGGPAPWHRGPLGLDLPDAIPAGA